MRLLAICVGLVLGCCLLFLESTSYLADTCMSEHPSPGGRAEWRRGGDVTPHKIIAAKKAIKSKFEK